MQVKIVSFGRLYLDLSWKWTSDEELRELIGAPIITKAQQENWFKSLKDKSDYQIFGIEVEGNPIGVAGLKRIVGNTAYVFWYIGEKQHHGKGIGSLIAKEITEIAKKRNINILYAETKIFNFKSINLLFKEGYKIIDYYESSGDFLVEKKCYD